MDEIKDVIKLINHWWHNGEVNTELAKSFKREKLKEIIKVQHYRQIVILSGLRRVGKTTLLYQLIDGLTKKEDARKIFYFTFDKKVEDIITILEQYKEITHINYQKEKIHVFFDEITKLKDWAKQIKIIYDSFPNIKFYLSSSSSISLEEEAIKNLAGRYFLINIKPLHFREYLYLRGKEKWMENILLHTNELKSECKRYLLRSFPEIVTWDDELLVKDYLRSTIIDKIIKYDLPDKFKNINKELLFLLLDLFYKDPGTYLDYDNLSKSLRISKKTLFRHIFYLEFCYLIRRIRNFRPSTLSSTRKLQRVYPYWWSFAYCYTDNFDKIFENVIASSLDLKYYWREKDKEVDFLMIEQKKITPIEIKNKNEVSNRDLHSLFYFMEKNKIKEALVIYQGENQNKKIEKLNLNFVNVWEFLLEH